MFGKSTIASLVLCTLSFALPASGSTTVTDVASSVHEHVLSNGLKVLLVENPKAPVVTIQIWYKVGSRNEVMGRAGLSHMLEHMMFKGTAKYPKLSLIHISEPTRLLSI